MEPANAPPPDGIQVGAVLRRLQIGALLVVLGCGTPEAQQPPARDGGLREVPDREYSALDHKLRRDLAGDNAFPWSPARPLTWNDFQGTPPTGGQEGAKTFYALYSAWQCRGKAFAFRAIAGFHPRESWVKPEVLDDPELRLSVLAHEQTHFDLGELHVRRMREVFAHLFGPCRKTDADLGALARQLSHDEAREQLRYDSETNHGLLAAEQAAWSLQIRQRLAASR
jgi:hypothetical protein